MTCNESVAKIYTARIIGKFHYDFLLQYLLQTSLFEYLDLFIFSVSAFFFFIEADGGTAEGRCFNCCWCDAWYSATGFLSTGWPPAVRFRDVTSAPIFSSMTNSRGRRFRSWKRNYMPHHSYLYLTQKLMEAANARPASCFIMSHLVAIITELITMRVHSATTDGMSNLAALWATFFIIIFGISTILVLFYHESEANQLFCESV